MNRRTLFLIFAGIFAGLNLGTIRKAEDPIRDTQTNPILYKQKMEEEKGGKKGPLLYHVKNYPREGFFIDPPFEKEKSASEGIVTEQTVSSSGDTARWWEEESLTPQEVPPAGTVSEPSSETLPEVQKIQEHDMQPASEPPPTDKGEDYGW